MLFSHISTIGTTALELLQFQLVTALVSTTPLIKVAANIGFLREDGKRIISVRQPLHSDEW